MGEVTMRKILVCAVLMAAGVCVLGQIPQPYIALLPGTTLNTQHDRSAPYPWLTLDREVKTGFIGSVEGGFPMTRFVGVHFGYVGTSQNFTLRQFVNGRLYGTGTGTAPVNILEIGPEFTWCPSTNQQLYLQLTMGHTVGSESVTTHYDLPYYSYQRTDHPRDNAWALGVALGYRWYFSKTVGLCVQATVHHVSGWSFSPIWAAQAGIAFRF
jgi:hypothetical protein